MWKVCAQDLMLSIGWMERTLNFASVRLPVPQATVRCFELTAACRPTHVTLKLLLLILVSFLLLLFYVLLLLL
jgi:hypothetical protein